MRKLFKEYQFAFAYCLISVLEPSLMLSSFGILLMENIDHIDLQRYTVRILARNLHRQFLRSSSSTLKMKEMAYSLDLASSVLYRGGNYSMADVTSAYAKELHKIYEVELSEKMFFADQLKKITAYVGENLQF